jgi:hypothetical protein
MPCRHDVQLEDRILLMPRFGLVIRLDFAPLRNVFTEADLTASGVDPVARNDPVLLLSEPALSVALALKALVALAGRLARSTAPARSRRAD